jgi:hypothetical protein
MPGDGGAAWPPSLWPNTPVAHRAGSFRPASPFTPLLTLRQNIYTDPQKPIQVSPGLYEIGKPTPQSPLLVTTNFSLTYFSVASEVEGSGIPARGCSSPTPKGCRC